MICSVAIPLLVALGPTKPDPAKVALEGTIIERANQPVYVVAEGKGGARVLLDESTVPGLKEAAMSELVMLPGAKIPEHTHDTSAELLYILEGRATMTLDGRPIAVREGMAIFIPAGMKHSFAMDTKVEPLRAVQVYTPGGPEQRFKKGEAAKE